MIPIFIGFDSRETIVFHVCSNSIVRQASRPVAITPLALNTLNEYTERHADGSNQFIYSRYLVPHLMNYQGWALFIDGDMILRDDIVRLWQLRDENKAVCVVKHDYQTRASSKYLGMKNENYPRKNWSSVVLWNCAHPANRVLTSDFVENSSGAFLHRFSWLDDELIGELPLVWNWLPDEFGANPEAKLLHFTLGSPCFEEYAEVPMASEWHHEKMLTEYCEQRTLESEENS